MKFDSFEVQIIVTKICFKNHPQNKLALRTRQKLIFNRLSRLTFKLTI